MPEMMINNVSLSIPEGDHERFWGKFGRGEWEPETLRVFDACIGENTTVLDIGAWIGPTTLYAALKARAVYAFEPDPEAFRRLRENVTANPDIAARITTLEAAVAQSPGTIRIGVGNHPGGSMSSALYAGGAGWDVPAISIAAFLDEHEVEDPLFVKMDIEGLEFTVAGALMDALAGRDYVLHLSTHPSIIYKQSHGRTIFRRVARRARLIWAQSKLLWALRKAHAICDHRFTPINPKATVARVLQGRRLTPDAALIVAGQPGRLPPNP